MPLIATVNFIEDGRLGLKLENGRLFEMPLEEGGAEFQVGDKVAVIIAPIGGETEARQALARDILNEMLSS
ncbi:hypothetical protein KKF59_00605 [Patescibacteria group bacterium]|nr:hypothetical protein [Patescibacteria group bacterium]MBU1034216.1 hypothetical protein [Patescibacteria group bacterium]MBU1630107.1 hypothetical protein [Patescibacteria group bacterium]MBU1907616.1 hypothetical protein [Patescibacteria group bacterium]